MENVKTGIFTLIQNEFGPLLSNSTFIDIYSKIWAMFKTPQTKKYFKNMFHSKDKLEITINDRGLVE